ncbi:MAG: D-alanyl-D-alanine carboxypeptidase/D-alanyl-D-alanine-endopeptidase [Spirochaetes bacterium]|nr:D-alanyl-D-alanine carboxypeptidase/D-alanyl-D-alanine-endopeptidase [Spirochaetota bacterium]
MNRKGIFIISIFLTSQIFSGCGPSGVDLSIGEGAKPDPSVFADCGFRQEQIGFILYDMRDRRVVASHNRKSSFIPASVTKAATTVAALDILGHGHRFRTALYKTGFSSGGVLDGDLYLKGSGDPFLTVAGLSELADGLAADGIKSIRGKFYYDESALVPVRVIDKSMEDDEAYNAGISALSFEVNSIMGEWENRKGKGGLEFFLVPSLPMNSASVAREELPDDLNFKYADRNGIEAWTISPKAKDRGRERLPVKRPGLFTAQLFELLCSARGIKTGPPSAGTVPFAAREAARHEGLTALDLADLTLTYSSNLMAEMLCLAASAKANGSARGLRESAGSISGYLKKQVRGIDWSGFLLANGSGLTVENRITPEQMLGIMLYASGREYGGRSFFSLLPVSGWKGSLAKRMTRPETAFRVWAKTGSVNYADGLAGYLNARSGKKFAFAVFITDYDARREYDSDPHRRDKKSTGRAYAWTDRARKKIDSLVSSWIADN